VLKVQPHTTDEIVYRAWTTGKGGSEHEKKLVVVKVYRGINYKRIAENEIEILRLVDHQVNESV
jgi:hypothetical protein